MTFPEGTVATPNDNEQRSLQKIVALLAASGGLGFSGGGVSQDVYPATPSDPTVPWLDFPTGGGSTSQWDVASQSWK